MLVLSGYFTILHHEIRKSSLTLAVEDVYHGKENKYEKESETTTTVKATKEQRAICNHVNGNMMKLCT